MNGSAPRNATTAAQGERSDSVFLSHNKNAVIDSKRLELHSLHSKTSLSFGHPSSQ